MTAPRRPARTGRRPAQGSRRSCRYARLTALLPLAAALLLSACSSAAAGSPGAASADAHTRRIAQVEFDRQCAMAAVSFPSESAITADLDGRLKAAGLTHPEWKRWHDALVRSPGLVAQFRQVSGAGCPKA